MKIVVLNGSPKGDISVTMQYINYIQKRLNEHEFKIINVCQTINKIERDRKTFDDIIDEIKSCQGVIWAFPLYVFTVHSQYQRFIELIFESKAENAFRGKYASIIATSIHFFDHTAINYMNSICDDLNMNYVDYFSAHMNDLEKEVMRQNLLKFMESFIASIQNKVPTFKNYSPITYTPIEYIPQSVHDKIDTSGKKIVIVADSLRSNNLKNMIEKFRASFFKSIELVNLQDIDIKGGCLGCIKCGYNYECVYTGKDGFINFYNSKLKTADIIIFAGEIKYRHLSAVWKNFLDRGFFNTHTPSLFGKQIGFIISGPLKQIPNLRQILESYVQWQGSNLVGFATDEYSNSKEIDEQLYALSYNLCNLSMMDFSKPKTFLGVAGMKLFRDEIWGDLRFPFIADHKAYKANNIYDFPQKNYKVRIQICILMLLSKFSFIRKKIYSDEIKPQMIKSLKKIVEDSNL